MTKFIQREDGEGFEIPNGEIFKLACCDCGLVHNVVVAIDGDKLGLAAERNNRSTGQRRRHMEKDHD